MAVVSRPFDFYWVKVPPLTQHTLEETRKNWFCFCHYLLSYWGTKGPAIFEVANMSEETILLLNTKTNQTQCNHRGAWPCRHVSSALFFLFRFPGLYISPLAWWMLQIFWSCCSRLTLMSMLWMMTFARHCFTPLSQTICMLLAFFLTTVCKDTGTGSLGYLLSFSAPFDCQPYLFYNVIKYLCVSCKK